MIGASVVSNSYTCFEPSTKTYAGLLRLLEFIQSFNSDFCADIHNVPFEDAEPVEGEMFYEIRNATR